MSWQASDASYAKKQQNLLCESGGAWPYHHVIFNLICNNLLYSSWPGNLNIIILLGASHNKYQKLCFSFMLAPLYPLLLSFIIVFIRIEGFMHT